MLYARLAGLLTLSMISALGFVIVYANGGQTQWAAATIGTALAAFMMAMVIYAHHIMPSKAVIEDRGRLGSGEEENDAATQAFLAGSSELLSRRQWFHRFVLGAVGMLGIAVLIPLRSLGRLDVAPPDFGKTSWRKGLRLVREDGTIVHAADLEVHSMLTVFPEGFTGPTFFKEMATDATILLRVPIEELILPPERAAWAPGGLLAFSKICTHAGCPVGLYRAAARQLFCPCHQSTFDVRRSAEPIFGPATQALPQLPLALTSDGAIVAMGGFSGPIGPSYWSRA